MAAPVEGVDRATQVQSFIMHHVKDADSWHIGPISIPLPGDLSLHMFMALIAIGFVFYFFSKLGKRDAAREAPRGFGNALEVLIIYVRDEICIASLGEEDGRRMAPTFLTFFFLILTMNLMGLVPIFGSVTGNFNATLALGAMAFFLMTVGAIQKNGVVGFFQAFIPHGIPLPILLIIFPLELLGVVIKAGVLALRLFANMLAGHLALFSVLGLLLTYGVFAAPAVLLGLFVFFLEILVAFLQAYIFTMLAAMFTGQIYHPEH